LKYLILLWSIFLGVLAHADERASVLGRWASDNSILEVVESGGQLHATIIALLDPIYRADEEDGVAGTVRVDSKNPNEALRARPLVGIDLLEAYSYEDGKWHGRIYDPESGKTYKSQMTVDSDGNLLMRGYIGMPMLGRTATFKPVASCTGNIPKMLASVSPAGSCTAG
jgi:uncharacterized protein (DUF2147 family)